MRRETLKNTSAARRFRERSGLTELSLHRVENAISHRPLSTFTTCTPPSSRGGPIYTETLQILRP